MSLVTTMKRTLRILIDSSQPDLGVTNAIETYRNIFEMTGGREQIAVLMENLLASGKLLFSPERKVTRQMIEKWFNQKKRTVPSAVMLVTLLTACELIQQELDEYKRNQRTKKVA